MLPTNPLLNATAPAGPHLPATLLRQYAAGTLAPAAQHRVEAHTLACPRCADILAGLQQTPPATTDQALAQLQQRLRQRVQQQAAPARHDREEQRNRWLIPQLAAAAALLLGLVAGGWWAWQQRHVTAPLATTTATPAAPSPAKVPKAPAVPVPQPSAIIAAANSVKRPVASTQTRAARRPLAYTTQPQATTPPLAADDTLAPQGAPLAAAAPPAPSVPLANASPPTDSLNLAGKVAGLAMAAKHTAPAYEAAPLRAAPMPATPRLPPTPVGGYSALRERLRREATEFKPEAPEQSLSGTVQLRLKYT